MVAWLQRENGYLRVKELIEKAQKQEVKLAMSVINFGEVIYRFAKIKGIEAAKRTEASLRLFPINIIAPVEEKLVMRAAYLKAQHPIAYADAFAAALAEEEKAILVTGDRDFKQVEKKIKIEWLR